MTIMFLIFGGLALYGVVAMLADHATNAPGGPATKERKPNRLIESSSPYLLQHAYNPVDWHEWGEPALHKAAEQDKPIFLSVGYSTCHWCHVMEHESFEDDEVATLLNERFVPIKVDREERPDIDEQYMLATQLSTQRGGWPNTVILTPDGRPWFAGTYFPKPQFMQLLTQLGQVWRDRRPDVEKQADQFAETIRNVGVAQLRGQARPLSYELIERGASYFESAYDSEQGGFGRAPKFPPHGALSLMLQQQRMQPNPRRLAIVTHTLDAMEHGGIHDHLGGGFHRYATDSRWFLPHFEKMLYDNAQLVQTYTEAFALTAEPRYRHVIAALFGWLRREMTDEHGGFYSALDADSEGEEGKYYVWTAQEIRDVLGDADAELFNRVYGVTEEGNYLDEATRQRTGANVLYLPKPIDVVAADLGQDAADLHQRLAELRRKLLERRMKRVRPHLDDKVVSGWNGLMLGALARAGRELDELPYVNAARSAADFVLQHMRVDGKLRRIWRAGRTTHMAYLDDYAFLIDGLIELYEATDQPSYLQAARELTMTMIDDFNDPDAGGFYFTSDSHERLLMRAKELGGGGNMPSGNGVAASTLIRLAVHTGEKRYADIAAGTLNAFAAMMASSPHGSESLLRALAQYQQAEREHGLPPLLRQFTTDADVAVRRGPVSLETYLSHDRVLRGERTYVAVRLTLEPGHHVYANPPVAEGESSLTPTAFAVELNDVATLGEIEYPAGERITDPVLNQPLQVYRGTVTLLAPLDIADDAPEGDATIMLDIKYQVCDERACLEPDLVRLELPITVAADAAERESRHGDVFRPLGVTET